MVGNVFNFLGNWSTAFVDEWIGKSLTEPKPLEENHLCNHLCPDDHA